MLCKPKLYNEIKAKNRAPEEMTKSTKKKAKKLDQPTTKSMTLEKPKKPPNTYLLFHKDRYEEIKSENKMMSMKEITKRTAEEWKSISKEKREQYLKMYDILKYRYTEELEAYKNANTTD